VTTRPTSSMASFITGRGAFTLASPAARMRPSGPCEAVLASSSNPIQLAHGISIALYNTAMGIIVAVPALIFYRHFRAKVDELVVEMEQQAIKLVDFAHGERK